MDVIIVINEVTPGRVFQNSKVLWEIQDGKDSGFGISSILYLLFITATDFALIIKSFKLGALETAKRPLQLRKLFEIRKL